MGYAGSVLAKIKYVLSFKCMPPYLTSSKFTEKYWR